MTYELWVTARRMPDLKAVMQLLAGQHAERLLLEKVAENFNEENLLAGLVKGMFPGAIVTCSVVPATVEPVALSGRDDRVLRALRMAQPHIPLFAIPTRDAIELAIAELTKGSPGQGSNGS